MYYKIRRIHDSANGVEYQYEATTRFLTSIIAGLSYQLALKNPNVVDRVQLLKGLYEEDFQRAAEEDRDRSDFKIVPVVS